MSEIRPVPSYDQAYLLGCRSDGRRETIASCPKTRFELHHDRFSSSHQSDNAAHKGFLDRF
jgi:hypothetical protein